MGSADGDDAGGNREPKVAFDGPFQGGGEERSVVADLLEICWALACAEFVVDYSDGAVGKPYNAVGAADGLGCRQRAFVNDAGVSLEPGGDTRVGESVGEDFF